MTEIFRNQDSMIVGHFQTLLETEGIKTYFRNEYASGTTVAVSLAVPTLCVLEEADLERAAKLIRDYLQSAAVSSAEEQTCSTCGEASPGTFAVCWNCGGPLNPKI